MVLVDEADRVLIDTSTKINAKFVIGFTATALSKGEEIVQRYLLLHSNFRLLNPGMTIATCKLTSCGDLDTFLNETHGMARLLYVDLTAFAEDPFFDPVYELEYALDEKRPE